MAVNKKKRQIKEQEQQERQLSRAADLIANFINLVHQSGKQITCASGHEVRVDLDGLNFSNSKTLAEFAKATSTKAAVLERHAMWGHENNIPYLKITGPANEVRKIKNYLKDARPGQKMSLSFIRPRSVLKAHAHKDGSPYVTHCIDMTPFIRHCLQNPDKMQQWLEEEFKGGEGKLVTKPVPPEEHLPHQHEGLVIHLRTQIKGINKITMHLEPMFRR